VTDIKNRFENPESGYMDIKAKVLRDDGKESEIQLHSPDTWRAKQATYLQYEKIRSASDADKPALEAQMQKMWTAAYNKSKQK
jgi:hypothetical protein